MIRLPEDSLQSPPPPSDPEQRYQLRSYAAGFIDLLGQRSEFNQLRAAWNQLPAGATEPTPELIAAMKNSVGRVLGIRQMFYNWWAGFSSVELEPPPGVNASEAQLDAAAELDAPQIEHVPLSDALLVYVPLATSTGILSGLAAHRLLVTSSAVMLTSMAGSTALRGGLDTDLGIKLGPRDFYGPVLGNVYELESREAEWPRIVLGPQLLEFINEPILGSGLVERVSETFRQACQRLIFEDDDGNYAVDFLGSAARDLLGGSEMEEQFGVEFDTVADCGQVFCEENSMDSTLPDDVRMKYRRALHYYRSRTGGLTSARRATSKRFMEEARAQTTRSS